jgi:hypothetical protein
MRAIAGTSVDPRVDIRHRLCPIQVEVRKNNPARTPARVTPRAGSRSEPMDMGCRGPRGYVHEKAAQTDMVIRVRGQGNRFMDLSLFP